MPRLKKIYNFMAGFDTSLHAESLESLNNYRLLALKSYLKRRKIAVPLLILEVIVTIFVGLFHFSYTPYFIAFLFYSSVFIYISLYLPYGEFKTIAKKKLVPLVFDNYSDLTYKKAEGIPSSVFNSSNLFIQGRFSNFTRHSIKGSSEYSEFQFCKAIMFNSAKGKRVISNGFIHFNLPVNFKERILIYRKGNPVPKSLKMKKFKVNNNKFRKLYNFYDQLGSYGNKIVTESFLNSLELFTSRFSEYFIKKGLLEIAMWDNNLLFMLPIKKNFLEYKDINKTVQENTEIIKDEIIFLSRIYKELQIDSFLNTI